MSIKEECLSSLKIGESTYQYYNLTKAQKFFSNNLSHLPVSLKILLENLIRNQDGKTVTKNDILAFDQWLKERKSNCEIAFRPARVLMQDFTGVPAIVDLAAMRDAIKIAGGDAQVIRPLNAVDLVIDHSVQVIDYGHSYSFHKNEEIEFSHNKERYEFLKWGQASFSNFRVVPPGTGICHQVNLELLGKVVWTSNIAGENFVYPDTLVGTDSHTTMINALSILGWGVGGIEAEAVMLGQPISMIIPEVVGIKIIGNLKEGVNATDLVLVITNLLRKQGVVDKFVEFFGPGLKNLSLETRATIANMAPECGATCNFFPTDKDTIKYLQLTGRDKGLIKLIEEYSKLQGLWADDSTVEPVFSDVVELHLDNIEPCVAGPRRPQDRIALKDLKKSFLDYLDATYDNKEITDATYEVKEITREDADTITHGDVAIAAITSCTNTSNPQVMIAAALVAKKALERGLKTKPWVKTSLAPGSKVVSEYLIAAGLQTYLDQLGFNLVGYGCTTCIGNSGPLPEHIQKTIEQDSLIVASVLSGNRNFEGRIHPLVKANYLASPPLVVIYALTGTVNIDLTSEAIGQDDKGRSIFLKDLWPNDSEVKEYIEKFITPKMFRDKYSDVFQGTDLWQNIKVSQGVTYNWNKQSSYIKHPPYFHHLSKTTTPLKDIHSASLLALFGDSITTDHISPAGNIAIDSPAARYLLAQDVPKSEFNSYGARRGNHEVMIRGTFANVRIRNKLTPHKEGGWTVYKPEQEEMTIYDAAMKYQQDATPLIIIAGKEYGTGSSRDWAAKGTKLLGVSVVIAEGFERIHRSNLIGMGVVPATFTNGITQQDLALTGNETFDIIGLQNLSPHKKLKLIINGKKEFELEASVFTNNEVDYLNHGGVLHYVLRSLM